MGPTATAAEAPAENMIEFVHPCWAPGTPRSKFYDKGSVVPESQIDAGWLEHEDGANGAVRHGFVKRIPAASAQSAPQASPEPATPPEPATAAASTAEPAAASAS